VQGHAFVNPSANAKALYPHLRDLVEHNQPKGHHEELLFFEFLCQFLHHSRKVMKAQKYAPRLAHAVPL
jgi:hypothetical protein